MIRITTDPLAELEVAVLLRPIRSDLAPVTAASRDVNEAMGPRPAEMLGRLGTLPVGSAVLTPAGELRSDYIVHVVVMSEDEPQTAATVDKALRNGLARAADLGLESIALPPLGLGVGLTEPELPAAALLQILVEHLESDLPPDEVILAVTSDFEADLFSGLIHGSGGRG
jgi:O-acetyl-ADP-ribose deacetylase (regulator of RNase III)